MLMGVMLYDLRRMAGRVPDNETTDQALLMMLRKRTGVPLTETGPCSNMPSKKRLSPGSIA